MWRLMLAAVGILSTFNAPGLELRTLWAACQNEVYSYSV